MKPMIRERRMEKHLSQTELASLIGINRTQLSKYETGMHMPGVEILMALEKALDCRLENLYSPCDKD